MNFEDIVDLLSSIASTIAICTVLYSWRQTSKPVTKIDKVTIYRETANSFNIVISIKNTKPYPIIIKNITCYLEKSIRIEKTRGSKPIIQKFYDSRKILFSLNENTTISEIGEHRFKTKINKDLTQPKSLVFLLETSHGFLKLQTKKITFFNQSTYVISPDFMITVKSHPEKIIIYLRGFIVYLIECSPFKLEKFKKLITPKGIN